MEKISIIVPVYNVEDYIKECLDSLVAQTYKDIEIVIVDDGSKDGSIAICEEYAKRYDNIVIYTKENGGLSDARNYGIKVAKAPYLMFVDSDDTLTPDACEVLLKLLEEQNVDIAIGELYRKGPNKVGTTVKMYEPVEALAEILRETSFSTSACAKLFKRELFEKVEFPKGMLFEDFGTVYKLFFEAKRIAYLEHDLYFYRVRENSITTQRFTTRKMDLFKIADEIDAYIEAHCKDLMKISKNRRTRYAISFLKEIAIGGAERKEDVEQLLSYVKSDIVSYLGSPYKITSKLFGVASAINYKAVVWMLRKIKHG